MKLRKTPFPASWVMNATLGPAGAARLCREAQPDADDDGKQRDHGQQRLVPPAAEDEPQLRPEETQPRPDGGIAALARSRPPA